MSDDGRWILDQAGDRLEQFGVFARPSTGLAGGAGDLFSDALLALVPVGEDVLLAKLVGVIARRNQHRSRHEPMAAGLGSALHVGERDAEGLAVEGRYDPVHRPRERIGLERVPPHRLARRYTTY